jgi:hypothetical protein
MPSRRKSGGGVMDGLCPAASRSDPRVTGLLAVEGTPAFGKALPFAGRCRNEGLWSIHEDGGTIQPSVQRLDDEQGVLE